MRIVVPLDGSPLAERALEPALHLLRRAPDAGILTLVQVVAVPAVVTTVPGDYTPYVTEDALRAEVAQSERYLASVAARPPCQGLTVETTTLTDAPASAIIATAHARDADMIVMTSHGHTGLLHLALGSVAEAVARDAHLPTLIVRPRGATLPDVGRFVPLTMLVPLDGTPLAEAALVPARLLAGMLHGSIHLLQVLPAGVLPAAEHRKQSQAAYAYLTRIHDQLQSAGITAHRALAWGDPAEQIALEASRFQTDLVVLTTHGRTGLARFLNGSVAEGVLHRVPLPVLIWHPAVAAVASAPAPVQATAG